MIDVFNDWRDKIDEALKNIRDFLPDLEILQGLLLFHITFIQVLKCLFIMISTILMVKHQKVFSNPYKPIWIS